MKRLRRKRGNSLKSQSSETVGRRRGKDDGQADSRPAKSFDEPCQIEGHGARASCQGLALSDGLSVSATRSWATGNTGYRVPKAGQGGLCARMLLAPASELQ